VTAALMEEARNDARVDAVRQSWMTSAQWEREPTAEEAEPREPMDEQDEARAPMGKEDEGEEEEERVEDVLQGAVAEEQGAAARAALVAEVEALTASAAAASAAAAATAAHMAALEAELEVGPGRDCLPRHPTHYEPSFIELNSIL